MHSTHLRREHIHGALLGVAIGEAIGLSYTGLKRRSTAKILRRNLGYCLPTDFGFYGENTRIMLLNAQALLNSRSEMDQFRKSFRRRLLFYALSLPPGIRRSHFVAGLKFPGFWFGLKTSISAQNAGPLTRALFSTLAIHGGGHRLVRWIDESTKLTHTSPTVIQCSRAIAAAAYYGITTSEGAFDFREALGQISEQVDEPSIRKDFARIEQAMAAGQGLKSIARDFNWNSKSQKEPLPITLMSLSCWLRKPNNFKRAIRSVVSFGGDVATSSAIVGGLVGAHTGVKGVPKEYHSKLFGWPHGVDWMNQLAERFSHWPHGADDLHGARSESIEPAAQLLRNFFLYPVCGLRWSAKRAMNSMYG